MINYITKHWRGELSLAISFWVNLVLINGIFSFLPIEKAIAYAYPPTVAGIILIFNLFWYFTIYPWQIVGVIRVGNRYVAENIAKVTLKQNL